MCGVGLGLGVSLALVASCDDSSTITPNSLNLSRPVDIAFACSGGMRNNGGIPVDDPTAPIVTTAQPTVACDVRSTERFVPVGSDYTTTVEPRPPGQNDVPTSTVGTASWYSFILESVPGTVAMAMWPAKPATQFVGTTDIIVLDADPLTPGKNAISVGEEPIAIETDSSGCFEVTANAGSCDVSMLDVNSAVALDGNARINRLPIVNKNYNSTDSTDPNNKTNTIYAKPAAMVGEPSLSVVGSLCPAAPIGRAYVAFPSCHIIATLDLSTGTQATIVEAIQYDASGVATQVTGDALSGLTCPAECSTVPGVTPGPISDATRPVALSYSYDPSPMAMFHRRLAIGADNSSKLTIVNFTEPVAADPSTDSMAMPSMISAISQIALEDKTPGTNLGVTALAMTQQIAMGGTSGIPPDSVMPGGYGQYVYAVATDHTVRVADVFSVQSECDTQVDPRYLVTSGLGVNTPLLQCFPVGGAMKPPRRSGARSPGIQLPVNNVPNSVAFIKPPLAIDTTGAPIIQPIAPVDLVGTFAIITTVGGGTFIANVDDDNGPDIYDPTEPQGTAPVLVMAHQLRDNISNPGLGATTTETASDGTTVTVPSCVSLGVANSGGPRTSTPPEPSTTAATAAFGITAASKVGELPSLRQVTCTADDASSGIAISEMELAADPTTRSYIYPDLGALTDDENWTMVWEGPLSADLASSSINGPPIREAQMSVKSTESAVIDDQTQPFCNVGVEQFDVVQLRGCDPAQNSLDCPNGYECYVHSDSQVQIGGVALGSCMLRSEADRLADACREFLISQRRYTVRYTSAGELELAPRIHELRTTPLGGCSTTDDQCQTLANYSVQNDRDQFSAADQDPHTWKCLADDTRKPFDNGSITRCAQTCTSARGDADCDVGSICSQPVNPDPTAPVVDGVCMEGIMPPQACVEAPQKFDVRAGEAFTLIGDKSGYIHPITKGADGQCIVDPTADPLKRGRIPLTAPACGFGGTMADPYTGLPVGQSTGMFEANPCSLTTATTDTELSYPTGVCSAPASTLTQRTAPAIKLRTRTMTLTMVDPYYPGDAQCPLDRGGVPNVSPDEHIPLVFPGFQIAFHVASGFQPALLQSYSSIYNPVIPAKVVAGPTGSIWVIDDGDYLSETIGLASTEGSVFRVESVNPSVVNQLQ
ncbi:MAG TPA: hypothetical protein VH165_02925 [Kofleriaceae bacterium]|nr:hypothetical protein [Kofleriaceae bacterium]